MKKSIKKVLVTLLAFSICVSSTNTTALALKIPTKVQTETNITVTDNDIVTEVSEVKWDGVTTESIYEGKNYRVTFSLSGHWEGGYNADVKVENTGNHVIENWALSCDYNGNISNIWNAVIDSQKDGNYVIKNADWNANIPVSGSVQFGLSGGESFKGFPEAFQILGEETTVSDENYSIDYVVNSDWGDGFSGQITINNNTEVALENWTITFYYNREITNIWSGVIEAHEGNCYIITNAEYNKNIPAGGQVSFGFNENSGSINDEPYDYQVTSSQIVVSDDGEEVDETADGENDGVLDYIEDYFGTDKTKSDTDGDGISDYIEIYVIGLDPTVMDTDGNGISDGDEDTDKDGLTNLIEVEIGTDLAKADTDSDKLLDGDEVNNYRTNPLLYDTDGDGVGDGREVELKTDPLVVEHSFHVSAQAIGEDMVKVSVDTIVSGDQVDSLSVERYDDDFLFPETMPGYIGGAYNFSVDGSFESATLKFEFDKALLSDASFDPIIYYFNEDTQLLEALDTTVEGNIATAVTSHFSKYILLNRKVYQNSFVWQDVWTTSNFTGVEVVLVIDDSGSMTSNDKANTRLSVAQDLVENLPENSKVGVVKFASSTSILTTRLTSDKTTAKKYLTTNYFKSSGGTYMYNAINSAFSLFESDTESTLKMIVVLSDGDTSDTSSHSSVVTAANNKKVKIYTVGLGSSTSHFTRYLKPLANNTAGEFYLAANASELKDIYTDINKKIDIETDSDGDGIADYYEDNMVMFNAVSIKLNKNNPDTDNDGVLDGEEVTELNYQYNSDKTKVIVTGKLLSNPIEPDSDYDGRQDRIDAAPLNNHFSGVLTTDYATSSIVFDMDYRWFFKNNTIYNNELSITSSLFASAIYHTNTLSIKDSKNSGTTDGATMESVMDYFGLKDAKTIELDDTYNDYHLSEVGIGYRTVSYNGQVKNVIAVIIRGTNGTIQEWSSNFEIGNQADFNSTSDWGTYNNHKGFDIAANRIMKIIAQYVVDRGLDTSECAYWVTGHSRGAGIANIIGAYYEAAGKTTYTYTYAAPNTTMDAYAGSYNTIFNVVNADDFVPCLPMTAWGYTRYGKTASVSIADHYEKQWEKLTDIWDYNPNTYGMQKTVDALGNIISGDARKEVYKYTCSCHGDNSLDTITITNKGTSKDSREKAIAKIPSNALPYCIITRYNGTLFFGWDFDNCQTPAYFMQILAAQMAGAISTKQFVTDLNIADRYEKAKTAIIKSAIGGLSHPHYTESYYVLANNITYSSFR